MHGKRHFATLRPGSEAVKRCHNVLLEAGRAFLICTPEGDMRRPYQPC
jgi:hypothetical protein